MAHYLILPTSNPPKSMVFPCVTALSRAASSSNPGRATPTDAGRTAMCGFLGRGVGVRAGGTRMPGIHTKKRRREFSTL